MFCGIPIFLLFIFVNYLLKTQKKDTKNNPLIYLAALFFTKTKIFSTLELTPKRELHLFFI
ncbi:MAG: hypothetical protein COZ18_03085 [Flexibacter sp. CG_4_10_14_3_um_filter_32_15]|nr:MAG: hypothetical protein COZ18_03085 [Flexibacter sp. CG_4_10_14_3_um_filter_32_15]